MKSDEPNNEPTALQLAQTAELINELASRFASVLIFARVPLDMESERAIVATRGDKYALANMAENLSRQLSEMATEQFDNTVGVQMCPDWIASEGDDDEEEGDEGECAEA